VSNIALVGLVGGVIILVGFVVAAHADDIGRLLSERFGL